MNLLVFAILCPILWFNVIIQELTGRVLLPLIASNLRQSPPDPHPPCIHIIHLSCESNQPRCPAKFFVCTPESMIYQIPSLKHHKFSTKAQNNIDPRIEIVLLNLAVASIAGSFKGLGGLC